MLHLIWYIVVGLIAGFVAKSVMHMHMTLLWTVVLGIVGSIVGGLITHLFSRPKPGAPFHPAGIIFSILGAILVLYLCHGITSSTSPLGNSMARRSFSVGGCSRIAAINQAGHLSRKFNREEIAAMVVRRALHRNARKKD